MSTNRADLNGQRSISATKLLAAELPEMSYLISGILPEGLGLVAGAPKVGKSWLTLQAAVEVATGGELLGRACEQRHVRYYALEDGQRRIQKRLRQLEGGRDISRLRIVFTAPRIGEGLEDEIDAWLTKHEGGFVVIDVLAKVRPEVSHGNAYHEDYAAMTPLHDVATSHPGCSITGNTHDRKAAAEDFLTTVTGTRGVTGSADWVWVIKRPRLDPLGAIYVVGRDIEQDMMLSAVFNGPWTPDDRPLPVASSERNRVYEWLSDNGPAFPKGVADGLGMSRNSAQQLLTKMHRAGQIRKLDDGYQVDAMSVRSSSNGGVSMRTVVT